MRARSDRLAAARSAPQGSVPGAPPSIRLVADVSSGEWRMPAGDYGNLRYSTLDTIKTTNVMNLHVVTTFSTGIPHGHEGQPLVFGNTMYVVTPFPNNLIAVDLTKPGGAVKWIYEPHPDPRAVGIACCDVVNRGAVVTPTARSSTACSTRPSSRSTPRPARRRGARSVGDINSGETFTGAPIVVKDKVLVGNSGGELGVRGYVAALDVNTGKELWRAFNTGPDADVKIGRELPRLLRQGSGQGPRRHVVAVGAMEARRVDGLGLDLVRPGDEPVLLRHRQSRRVESGSAARRQQVVVDDLRARRRHRRGALGLPGHRARLVGLRRDHGERARRHGLRRPSAQAARPPRPHRIRLRARSRDRRAAVGRDLPADELGERLRPEDRQAASRIPPSSTHFGTVTQGICPSSTGAKDVIPSAFSPRTGLLYIPAHNTCMDYEGIEANYIAGTPYLGADVKMYPGPGGYQGELVAWDVAHNRKAWGVKEDEVPGLQRRARHRRRRRLLRDDGRLVQGGRRENRHRAVEVSRRVRHRRATRSPTSARTASSTSRSIPASAAGWARSRFPRSPPTIPTPALGVVGAMKDIKKYTAPGSTVYVFGL